MKTITISVDEATYRYCERNAEAAGASVEQWAAERLAELMPKPHTQVDAENSRHKRQEIIDLIRSESPGFSAADRLPREELYDRDASRCQPQQPAPPR